MSNAAKAKQILDEYFHSGQIDKMDIDEVIKIYDKLASLWSLINGNEIKPGISKQEVRDLIGAPVGHFSETWVYPSTFEEYYYSIEFESGNVKETDFVILNIS